MLKSYCGKCSEDCSYFKSQQCKGCGVEAEGTFQEKCKIQNCCKRRGMKSCSACSTCADCILVRKAKTDMPQAAMERARFGKDVLGKLWFLFIVTAVIVVSNILLDYVSAFYFVHMLAVFSQFIALYLLIEYSAAFKKAVIYSIIQMPLAMLAILFIYVNGMEFFSRIFSVAEGVVAMLRAISMFGGLSDLVKDINRPLSDKWQWFKKFYAVFYGISMIGMPILALIMPFLAMLFSFASPALSIFITAFELFYLYKEIEAVKKFVK